MKSGKAGGADGAPPEFYRQLPIVLLRDIFKLFSERFAAILQASPLSWTVLEYIGIPKSLQAKTLNPTGA